MRYRGVRECAVGCTLLLVVAGSHLTSELRAAVEGSPSTVAVRHRIEDRKGEKRTADVMRMRRATVDECQRQQWELLLSLDGMQREMQRAECVLQPAAARLGRLSHMGRHPMCFVLDHFTYINQPVS